MFLTSFTKSFARSSSEIYPWTLWKKESSTAIYYRKVPDSDLIEIEAKVRLTSSLSGFLFFLQDTDNIPNWLDNAKKSKILDIIDANNLIFKTKFYGFWPIKSREMIIKSRQWQNDDLSIEILIENALNYPASDNTILVDVISAHWLITPNSEKEINVTYTFIVDAKGSLPMWLVNRVALKSIWKTLVNIKDQLPHSRWQSSKLELIKEMNEK